MSKFKYLLPFAIALTGCAAPRQKPVTTSAPSSPPAAVATLLKADDPATELICQEPNKKTKCLRLLKALAEEKNISLFKSRFVQFCSTQDVTCKMFESTAEKAKESIKAKSPKDRIYYIPMGADKVSIFAALAP